ncbi:MAG: T9SS type A sorting domain-containing protein [Ignavibacteria bacterium]
MVKEGDKSAVSWEKIGYVRASGNSNRPVEYVYDDVKLNTGKYIYRLKMIDYDGSYEYSDELEVEIGKPAITKLEQNYPNSFNPATIIEYQLSNSSKVGIEVYNITGQRVATLVNTDQDAGYYNILFDASRYGLSSGVYFYRMIAIDNVTGQRVVQTKKMLYLK